MSLLRQIEPSDSPNQLTIEQLAAGSGMPVRNIRAHQARGLLARPEVRMRVERPLRSQRALATTSVNEDQFEVPSNSLLAAAQDVVQSGISLREGLAILEERMSAQVEDAFGEITRRLSGGVR